MNAPSLDLLAAAYNLQLSYLSEGGETHTVTDAAKRAILRAMGVAAESEEAIACALREAPAPVPTAIAAPADKHCFVPGWLESGRAWGVTCQLYGLSSTRNHGIGDFEDLASLAETVAGEGGDFLGVNPLHALFTAAPERCSPFSPSNRRFLNPLYIAIDRLPGLRVPLPVDEVDRERLRVGDRVDYRAVAAHKLGTLREVWREIAADPALLKPAAWSAFETFAAARGTALKEHALFEALSNHLAPHGHGAGWFGWPEAYRDAQSDAVERFSAEHADVVRFHMWLQWVADTQLAAAAGRARAAGMRIGLYLDLAVGVAPDGAATWSDPAAVSPGANVGAPPDTFFAGGQDWGLAPISPAALLDRALAPYRDVLSDATRHAGAIRLDHAMHVHRLFWIPHGMAAAEGCYVTYPTAEMLRVVAETSQENRTMMIGEDLGTVPKGFRKAMKDVGMLSYRVLYFEWTRGAFRASRSYERHAFLCAATHDLPTLAAWWTGEDIGLFREAGVFGADEAVRRGDARRGDRLALAQRLRREAGRNAFAVPPPDDAEARAGRLSDDLIAAVHGFLARTPSRLLAIQFEDLCGARRPVNIPGTSDEYPNWRLRAPTAIEDAPGSALWGAVLSAVRRERPRCP